MHLIDMTGMKIGRLKVICREGQTTEGKAVWKCICKCGNTAFVAGVCLRRKRKTQSCGCRREEGRPTNNFVHGHTRKRTCSPTYKSWMSMIDRCTNPANSAYKRYGAIGISVCKRWHIFKNFLADMGPRPSLKYTLDRYPNNIGNYRPGNCRWATQIEQNNNKTNNRIISLKGTKMTLSNAARYYGIKRTTVSERLKNGWTIEEAFGL